MISVNGKVIEFGHFPNGEVNLPKLDQGSDYTVILKYENDADLFRLLFVRQWLQAPVHLEIPYFPYSRMDRRSDDYEFTLYSVADFINYLDFDSVTIYEPHSDVTPALLEKCVIVNVIPKLVEQAAPVGLFHVFYPDAGAQKRYSELLGYHPDLELVGFKKRDFSTGRIKELKIMGEPKYDTVLIIDDLCSKGGTFVLAAEKLREMGFKKIYLLVAHCEKTIFDGKVFSSGLIDHVFTTDSIYWKSWEQNDKLTIYSLKELVGG